MTAETALIMRLRASLVQSSPQIFVDTSITAAELKALAIWVVRSEFCPQSSPITIRELGFSCTAWPGPTSLPSSMQVAPIVRFDPSRVAIHSSFMPFCRETTAEQ